MYKYSIYPWINDTCSETGIQGFSTTASLSKSTIKDQELLSNRLGNSLLLFPHKSTFSAP